jgi:hypothetical protein
LPYCDPYFGSKEAQIALFDELVSSYPLYCRKEIIGYSVMGKPIPMYRVGNPKAGKFLFDGSIHGESDVSPMVHHLFLKWLLEAHSRVMAGSTDPWDLRGYNVIERKCLLCVPIINVDMCVRKNANGVDLNRNFTYNWSSAGSTDPSSDYYRGPSPASEPETQAMIAVFQREVPEVYCNFHNWGGLIFRGVCATSEQATLCQQIANAYNTIREDMGITDTIYSYYKGGPSPGFATADAALTPGVKAVFLVEICRSKTTETTRPAWSTEKPYPPYRYVTDDFYLDEAQTQKVSSFYKRTFPMLLAMAEAVTEAPPITHMKYVFKQWQDGDTNPTKTIIVPSP